jgi:two-component system, NarL family, response regulator NreC
LDGLLMNKKDSSKYNILLVDDHPPVRRLVKKIIEANPDLKVIGEFNDGQALLNFLQKSPGQLVVMDISMPKMNGFEASRRVKIYHPEVKVLMLTIHNDKEYLDRAISLGVQGYLLKDEMDQELVPAITSIRQGKTYISSRLTV